MSLLTARAAASVRRFVTRAHSAVSPVEKRLRIQAINDIAAEVKQEQSQTDNPEASARAIIKKLDNYSTKTIMCIRDGLKDTGKIHQFINYHDYVTDEEQLRVAVHYKDSGLINAFSICMTLKGVVTAVGRSYIKRHPQGTTEYQTTLDILTVSLGAQKNHSHIAKEKAFNLSAEGYMRREANGIVETQMLNDGSRNVMTKELADVIKQYPNRAEDISDFLGNKLMTPVHADLDLLRIYLSTESKAMSEGVL